LLYAFTILAINPSIQETLRQEIHSTIGDRLPTYEDFNNLVYPLCVLLETLRMFPPVIAIPKCTANGEQTLLGKHYIPKDVTLHFDTVHLHRNPKYWGDDVDTFNPSRFDGRNLKEKIVQKDTGDTAPGATNEKIRMPVKGAFVPFSEGSRSCLGTVYYDLGLMIGRKFSQVEFVACLVIIMQRWRIELKEGWSVERVWEVIDESISIITMIPPVDIPLVFKKL
jgi:cytochrome P450